MNEIKQLRLALETVSNLYISMHVFDLQEGVYSAIKTNEHIEAWAKGQEGLQAILNNIMSHLATEDSRAGILEFMDLSKLGNRMEKNPVETMLFHGSIHGWCNAKFIRVGNDDPVRYVMFIVENVDAQTRELESARKRAAGSRQLKAVLRALMEDYSTVCALDMKKNEVEVYKLHSRIKDISISVKKRAPYIQTMAYYLETAVHPDDQEMLEDLLDFRQLRNLVDSGGSHIRRYRNNEGRYGELKMIRTGEDTLLMGFVDRDQEIQAINQQVYEDSLTHVYNRKFYDEHLYKKSVEAVAMMDVDHFKSVNDTYGHQCGDMALEAVAGVLKSLVFGADYVVRYGGDEFLLVFPQIQREVLERKLEEVRQAVEQIRLDAYPDLRLTLSIGCRYGNALVSEALPEADQALYESKKTRNRVTVSERVK